MIKFKECLLTRVMAVVLSFLMISPVFAAENGIPYQVDELEREFSDLMITNSEQQEEINDLQSELREMNKVLSDLYEADTENERRIDHLREAYSALENSLDREKKQREADDEDIWQELNHIFGIIVGIIVKIVAVLIAALSDPSNAVWSVIIAAIIAANIISSATDADADGVHNNVDLCPLEEGLEIDGGCPVDGSMFSEEVNQVFGELLKIAGIKLKEYDSE